jgi:hypothetical protein
MSVVSMFFRYLFRFLIFLFLSPFSSFLTGEAPDPGSPSDLTIYSRRRHVSPVALSVFTAALTAYHHPTQYYPQPTHSERTGRFQPIINLSSCSRKLTPLQLSLYQRSRFAVFPTSATATTSAPHPIAITTTATTCLPMVCTAFEPLTAHSSQ